MDAKIRRWGNAFGVLLPKSEMMKKEFREGEEVEVSLRRKKHPLSDLFGICKPQHKINFDSIVEEMKSGHND